ncbi:MAG: DMT family transporter [Lacibacter sp.]
MQPITQALFRLHIAVFLAGFTGILGRLITLNEGVLVAYRMVLAAAVLFAFFLIRKQSVRLPAAVVLRVVFVGALIALHWVFFYGSIKYGNVSVALVCFAATGAFTAVLEPLLLRRPFQLAELLLGLLVLAGIGLIFHFEVRFKTAVLLGLGAAFLSALFPIFNKQLVQRVAAPVLTLYEMAGGALVLLVVLPFYLRLSPAHTFWPTLWDWIWMLVLVVFCTVWTFHLTLRALQQLSPFTVNLTYNLEPLYGIALAFLLFSEHLQMGTGFWLGFFCIILSVAIQSVRVARRR